jgi:hypothetical protein
MDKLVLDLNACFYLSHNFIIISFKIIYILIIIVTRKIGIHSSFVKSKIIKSNPRINVKLISKHKILLP